MTSTAPISTSFRASVLVTACAGLVLLATTRLLSTPVAAMAIVLACAAAAAPRLFPSPAGRTGRWVVAVAVMVAGAGAALLSAADFGSLTDIATALGELGRVIAPLMTGVLIAQFLVADRPRDLAVALVLGCTTFLLGVGLAPRPAMAIPLLVAWPAVVTALHEAHAAQSRDRADVVAVPDRNVAPARASAGSVVMLAAVSAALAIIAAFVIPASAGVEARGRLGSGGVQSFGSADRRSVEAYSSGVLDLRVRGELPDTPVAEVPADSPTHWRGVVLSFYDGDSWRATAGRARAQSTPAPAVTPATRRDHVRIKEGFAGVLLSPGHPHAVDVRGAVVLLDGGLGIRRPPDGRYPTTYDVTSVVNAPPAAALRASEGTDPTTIDVLGLPPRLPARVRQLGQSLAGGATSRYDAVRAVERHLRANATYRLDSPVPPRGTDAVDHFLFTARTGFCEQFASAEAVLLRAAGIPARLVTGFAGGTMNGDGRLLRSTDAHVWVEVWYPGIGWVASDPTDGVQLAEGAGSWIARMDALVRAVQRTLGLAGALGAVAVVLLCAVAVSRWRTRRQLPGRRLALARSPLIAAFGRLEAALERAGAPRAPAESLTELSARLPRERQVTSALTVLGRVCYSHRPPGVADVQEATRVIDDLAARMLAEQPH